MAAREFPPATNGASWILDPDEIDGFLAEAIDSDSPPSKAQIKRLVSLGHYEIVPTAAAASRIISFLEDTDTRPPQQPKHRRTRRSRSR